MAVKRDSRSRQSGDVHVWVGDDFFWADELFANDGQPKTGRDHLAFQAASHNPTFSKPELRRSLEAQAPASRASGQRRPNSGDHFCEMLEESLRRYQNRAIEAAKVNRGIDPAREGYASGRQIL